MDAHSQTVDDAEGADLTHSVPEMDLLVPVGNDAEAPQIRPGFQRFRLDDKAFLQVSRTDSPGLETPKHMERFYYWEFRII